MVRRQIYSMSDALPSGLACKQVFGSFRFRYFVKVTVRHQNQQMNILATFFFFSKVHLCVDM